jgi:hypothetical protein
MSVGARNRAMQESALGRGFFQRGEATPPQCIWKRDPSLRLKDGSAQDDASRDDGM